MVLYKPGMSLNIGQRKFYATSDGVVHTVVESPPVIAGLDALPLVLYRPLRIAPPVGYRKFYVNAAGVAYEIVGRPMPKHRTRRGKKNKGRKAQVEPSGDKENMKPESSGEEKTQAKEKARVPPSKTHRNRRSEQTQAVLTAAATGTGTRPSLTDIVGSPSPGIKSMN